ncbi:acyl-CoA thioesterase [Coxiella-like endosymbiont]|uniref:acyl-CoA thioesterase n=1 Tax=Coxiella-like endosymbiont TaxID=1592897 RepID=UPI00272A13FA|nr:acyl-CoA thioesterase [Coxiella-like endosymbiont]
MKEFHAIFLHYFEQYRNDYARSVDIDFYKFHLKGYDLAVSGLEARYYSHLKAEDEFYVTSEIGTYNEQRLQIVQEIRNLEDKKLVASASISITCVDQKNTKSLYD